MHTCFICKKVGSPSASETTRRLFVINNNNNQNSKNKPKTKKQKVSGKKPRDLKEVPTRVK